MTVARLESITSWIRFISWSSRPECSLACGFRCFREICGLQLEGQMSIALPSETLVFTYQITVLYYTEDHPLNIHRH